MVFHIRPATLEDLPRCAAIESTCFPPEQAASAESIRRRIESYPGHVLLGVCEGEVVGYIMGPVITEPYLTDAMYDDPSCHREDGSWQAVFSLAVIPPLQHRGIGGQLIHAMLALGRREGRKAVTLTCLEEKVRYYESFGFENRGISTSVHGGKRWYNMVHPL